MDESSEEAGGLLSAGKRALRSAFDLARARFELFLVELQEERIRLFDALLLLLLGVGCALMTLVLLTFALVIIFWDHRVLVLILLTLAYALAAGGALWTLWRRLRDWKAFAATLDEFKKDRACLDEQK
ncbi:MAG TPA: phage holin family protein [Verrucomicrobiae bacterium]|nr:phage holin family protein [Verrucomicrobiae bacterium]